MSIEIKEIKDEELENVVGGTKKLSKPGILAKPFQTEEVFGADAYDVEHVLSEATDATGHYTQINESRENHVNYR